MSSAPDAIDLGKFYRTTRERLASLVQGLTPTQQHTAVPACPGWSVHDVIAHLVGIIEDAFAGRLSGPPAPGLTAEQVARHRADDIDTLTSRWAELAPAFEAALTERQIWSAVLDVLSHEQDIRGALGLIGARDEPALLLGAQRLTELDDPSVSIIVTDRPPSGPPASTSSLATCVLHASGFEVLRFRLGRRTRAQVATLDWTGDPEPFLDELFVFGPAVLPIVE